MTARDLMRILQKTGVCHEKTYPYGKIELPSEISTKAKDEAGQYKIKTYGQISSVNNLRYLLWQAKTQPKKTADRGPVLVLVPCYNWERRDMWVPTTKEEQEAYERDDAPGHAFLCMGYDDHKEAFLFRNSWGQGWGLDGYVWFNYSDWRPDRMWECWMFIDQEAANND